MTSPLRIHGICDVIRSHEHPPKRCQLCPAKIDTPYGKATQGCRLIAQEAYNIAVYGNPWGKDAPAKNVENWRKRLTETVGEKP
jgi:hypothetical protein